jgi:hypothetical protein
MGMNDWSLVDKIKLIFITLTSMAIHHCLSVWKTGEFHVQQQISLGDREWCRCDTTDISYTLSNACIDVLCHPGANTHSSLPAVQARKICHIRCIIHRRIPSTSPDQQTTEHYTNQSCIQENFLDFIRAEQIERPDSSFNCFRSFLTSIQTCMWFTVILCMGGSAINSSRQLHQQKHFRLGGMAQSSWTCCITAIRDTMEVDYSEPGVNGTFHVAYHPQTSTSPVLLALSVSYIKRKLLCCGQL